MAAITDKFNKAADGTGAYPSIASVTAARGEGGDILICDDLSGWAKDTAVHFSTYRLLPDGTVDTNTQTDWKGIVVDNTITQMTRLAGAEDSGHLAGDKIELNPTIGWLDDLITGLLKSHNQDGTLKNSIVQTKNIAEAAITADKIANGAAKANMDWESLETHHEAGTQNNVSSEVILSTYTVPEDGKYTIDFEGSTAITGSTHHIFDIGIYCDDQKIWGNSLASIPNYAGNNSACISESVTKNLSKGDKITLKAKVSNATTKVFWTLNINQIW